MDSSRPVYALELQRLNDVVYYWPGQRFNVVSRWFGRQDRGYEELGLTYVQILACVVNGQRAFAFDTEQPEIMRVGVVVGVQENGILFLVRHGAEPELIPRYVAQGQSVFYLYAIVDHDINPVVRDISGTNTEVISRSRLGFPHLGLQLGHVLTLEWVRPVVPLQYVLHTTIFNLRRGQRVLRRFLFWPGQTYNFCEMVVHWNLSLTYLQMVAHYVQTGQTAFGWIDSDRRFRVGVVVDITPDGIWFLCCVGEIPVFIPRLQPTVLEVYALEEPSELDGGIIVREFSGDISVVPVDERVPFNENHSNFPYAAVRLSHIHVAQNTTVQVVGVAAPHRPSVTELLWAAIARWSI